MGIYTFNDAVTMQLILENLKIGKYIKEYDKSVTFQPLTVAEIRGLAKLKGSKIVWDKNRNMRELRFNHEKGIYEMEEVYRNHTRKRVRFADYDPYKDINVGLNRSEEHVSGLNISIPKTPDQVLDAFEEKLWKESKEKGA